MIEEYERVYAKFAYEKKRYWQIKEGNISDLDTNRGCCNCKPSRSEPKKPENPRIHLDKSKLICCRKKAVEALPFYLREIKNLNRRIESEYKKVTEMKQSVEDRAEYNDIYHTTVDVAKTFLTGEGSELQVSLYNLVSQPVLLSSLISYYIKNRFSFFHESKSVIQDLWSSRI